MKSKFNILNERPAGMEFSKYKRALRDQTDAIRTYLRNGIPLKDWEAEQQQNKFNK